MNIQSRSVEIYTTSDGRDWTDQSDALRHQAVLDQATAIDEFVATREFASEAAATRTANLIRDWVAFTAAA